MRSPTTLLTPFLLFLFSGCYHPGEADYLHFDLPEFGDLLAEFRSGDQLLIVGHGQLCPTIAAEGGLLHVLDDIESTEVRACFDETVSGPGTLNSNGCLDFEGAGVVTWTLTPRRCGQQPERLRFNLVNPGPDLELGFDEWRLRWLQDHRADAEDQIIGLAPGRTFAELQESSSEQRRVVAGELDVPVMRFDNGVGRAFWLGDDVTFEVVGDGVQPVPDPNDTFFQHLSNVGAVPVQMEAGSRARVRATLRGELVYESPELLAVTADTARSLDLIAVDQYLFADVRDAEGRLLHAAPIDWSLDDGALVITHGSLANELLTPEFAYWDGASCEKPPSAAPEQRHAVVRARLGELEDTVEVTFLVEPAVDDVSWSPDPACEYADDSPADDGTGDEGPDADAPDDADGCSCATQEQGSPTAPPLIASAVVGLIALARRRRRS